MEGPYREDEKSPPRERLDEQTVQESLRVDQPANSGNNGLIFVVPMPGTDGVVQKLLKVYHPGEGVREHEMQVRAYEALACARVAAPDEAFALIPEPGVFRDMRLTKDTVDHLNSVGAHLSGDRAEVIEMDFIAAQDFATIALTEVIERTEPARLEPFGLRPGETPAMFIAHLGVESLQHLVGRLLRLENTRRADREGNPYEDRAALLRNSRRIFSFLASRGWQVNERLAQQLENTLKVLHEAGVWHNDVHERNVMIAGDPSSPDAQAYLIDFGSASPRPLTGEGAREDIAMVNLLQDAALTKDVRLEREIAAEREAYREELERLRERAPEHQRYLQFRVQFMADHERALAGLRATNERELSATTLILLGALDEHLVSPAEARVVVARILQESSQPAIRRRLRWLGDALGEVAPTASTR